MNWRKAVTFDDIDYEYGGHAYVWVKPSEKTWEQAIGERWGKNDEWRPAKLIGYCFDEKDRGSQLDGRRLEFFGSTYAYRLDDFECGGVFAMEETPLLAPSF